MAARTLLEEGVTLFRATGDRVRLADALCWNAAVAAQVYAEPELTALLEESLAIYQALEDTPGTAKALNFLGELAHLCAATTTAPGAHSSTRSLALYQQSGQSGAIAVLRHNLGYVAQHQRDYTRASALLLPTRWPSITSTATAG